MKIRKYAAIDIGSNAVRLLISNVIESKQQTQFIKNSLVRLPIRLGQDSFTSGKISVRNIRRDYIENVRKLQKNGDISEDQKHQDELLIQQITDEIIVQQKHVADTIPNQYKTKIIGSFEIKKIRQSENIGFVTIYEEIKNKIINEKFI